MKLLIPHKCIEDFKKLTNGRLVSKLRFCDHKDAQYIVALYIFHRIRKQTMAQHVKYSLFAALITIVFGIFIAWIGGATPFTWQTGLAALGTTIAAIVVFFFILHVLTDKS